METSSSSSADESQYKTLNAKYQKLAAEYAKLRSQVQVLKKGVVDEKEKQEVLRETVTSQDQSIRKLEQELDSVKFRNRQLEKRIGVLQEGQQSSSQQSRCSNTQVDSNLLVHVEQNKVLQEQLALLEEVHSGEVGRLRRMIDFEMVPKEMMEGVRKEGVEVVRLLNKKVSELVNVNSELRLKVEGFEGDNRLRGDTTEPGRSSVEVEDLVKRVTESELQREKLGSEVQILRMKLKRVNEDYNSNVTSPSSTNVQDNMLGRVTMTTTTDNSDSDLLESYLRSRINELISMLQVSDSKAVHYYSECVNLCKLVRCGNVSYKRLDAEFGKLKSAFNRVVEELGEVKCVYEKQVDSLTEHIGGLNERIARGSL